MLVNQGAYDAISKIYETFAVTSKSRYVYVYDIENNMARWSENAVNYFGLPGEFVYKADQVWEAHIHPEDRATYREHLHTAFEGNRVNPSFEYRARNKSGEYVACSCRGVVIKDYSGKAAFYACSLMNKGIVDNTDPITGLSNHYEMFNYMHRLEFDGVNYILLLVNVIDFGDINRLYGYMFGNRMLKSMADYLQKEAGEKAHIYRGDGTILGLCTVHMTLEEVKNLYQQMRQHVRQNMKVGTTKVSAELGGGVIVVDESGIDVHAVYTSAKYALAHSKTEKHGNLIIFHNNELEYNKSTIELVGAVRESVIDHCKGFYLNYQPILAKNDGKLAGAEVLLRWNRQPYGDVAPSEFVPWLEQDSTFYKLGIWILDKAMKDGLAILKDHPEFYLSINLAYVQLERSEFRTSIVELLKGNRYPGTALCIELSNVTSNINFDYLKSQVIFLKSCGIRIALDVTDFSTLDLATRLPINIIKLAPEITENISKSPLSRYMAEAITGFAANMNMSVCATGVGDADTELRLFKYPVDHYQGYYYSRPVSFEEFKKLPVYKTNN
ncbi:sensor domain-containing phosphodiesterase [Butyrivibrio sp. WCD2001]|uniref:sensor domain-containing phosphodiesterase n=1 Tax=Butyrivibrio sp. WCD2001 TaxID=1280681 RepID=UPI0004032272|nr:EAL domain-containing protein [Butyrivibrio sp. WCD2001]